MLSMEIPWHSASSPTVNHEALSSGPACLLQEAGDACGTIIGSLFNAEVY
jgi:hypothetical protein